MPTITLINTKTRNLCDADSTSYPDAELLLNVNESYERRVSQFIGMDGLWGFDDTNYSNFPKGKTTLVAGQKDYSFNVEILSVDQVQVKDNGGIWHKLREVDRTKFGMAEEEYMKENGLPFEYDLDGGSIVLYPAPKAGDVTLADGLQVFFQRTADIFTSAQVTTGTKLPGFASPFHYLLSYDAAIPWCLKYKPARIPHLEREAQKIEKLATEHYGRRERDRRKVIKPREISHK